MTDKAPKSLREMAADTAKAEGAAGIRCPVCNCADTRVQTTRRGDGVVIRYRVCRHCGGRRQTLES